MNWGSFGNIVFRLEQTPKELGEDLNYKFAIHERIGRRGVYEFLGHGESKIEISFVLTSQSFDSARLTEHRTPSGSQKENQAEATLKTFEKYARTGAAKPLVLGQKYKGEYVITSIKKKWQETDMSGRIVAISVQISFMKS